MRAWEEVRRPPPGVRLRTTAARTAGGDGGGGDGDCGTGGLPRRGRRERRSRRPNDCAMDANVGIDAFGDDDDNGKDVMPVVLVDEGHFNGVVITDNARVGDDGERTSARSEGGGIRKGRRAGRKRWRRRGREVGDDGGTTATTMTAANATTTTNVTTTITEHDLMHYRMMVRVIVAPFTLPLMTSVKRQIIVEAEKASFSSKKIGETRKDSAEGRSITPAGGEERKTRKKKRRTEMCSTGSPLPQAADAPDAHAALAAALTTAISCVRVSSSSRSAPRNVYEKLARGSSLPRKGVDCPFARSAMAAAMSSLSLCESLETIVDGALCTLVRRSHCFRQYAHHLSASLSSSGREDAVVVNRRRRQRRKATTGADSIVCNYSANAAIGRDNHGEKPFSFMGGDNHWLLEENLLSAGYSLGSGGDHCTTQTQRMALAHTNAIDDDDDGINNDRRQRPHQSLRGCPNMAPGIHCLHPNTLTSYARSSTFMR